MLTRKRALQHRPRRRPGRFLKRWTVPTIGAITPLLLITVNIAAFIVHHLQTFRLIIAVCAFISGLMLNSWAGIKVYQYFHKRHPDHGLAQESNQELVIVGGMAIVIVVSAITAWACYQGLASDQQLPNTWTFVLGVVSIAVPVMVRELFSRGLGAPGRRDSADADSIP